MSVFDDIQKAIRAARYRITIHATREMDNDKLFETDIIAVSLAGEAIEEHVRFQPGVVVLGRLPSGAPVHAVWAYSNARDYAVLKTAYRPDPAKWSADFRQRVKP